MKILFEQKFGKQIAGQWGEYFVIKGSEQDKNILLSFLRNLSGVYHINDSDRHSISGRYFIRFDSSWTTDIRILYPYGTEGAILNFCRMMGYEVYEEYSHINFKTLKEGKLVDYDLFSN